MEKNIGTMPQKKFDSHNEGVRIVKVAAFCFAIISWIATAQGLHEYVFQEQYWQALLISFGIQSILFVFNLKLPEYFTRMGEYIPKENRKNEKNSLGKRKLQGKNTYKWIPAQKLMACFYAVILLSSSFFSFVYMTNLVYKNTQYIDANIVLDRTYRMYLNDTEEYVDEFTKVTQLNISTRLSELSNMIPDGIQGSSKTKSELQNEVTQAQKNYDDAIAEKDKAQNEFDAAKKTYETPMDIRWRSKSTHEKEYEDYQNANSKLEAAIKKKNAAWQILENAQQALTEYKPSAETTVRDALVEILKPDPDISNLNSLMVDLNDMVVQLGENNTTTTNFADIVTKTKELSIAINNYSILHTVKSAEGETNDIEDLKNMLLKDTIVVPVTTSKEFNTQKINWELEWKKRFSSLEKIIKNVPNYSKTYTNGIEEAEELIDVTLLKKINAQKISNKINVITRKNLSTINALERACALLFSDFPFLAWFSFLLALFFDVSSLLAGLFIFYTSSIRRKEYNNVSYTVINDKNYVIDTN